MLIINTVTDLKREYYRKSSGHWFDKDTMRFFRSRVGDKIYENYYFISSEQFNDRSPRLYTIRKFFIKEGKIYIDTVGEFQQFETYNQAKRHILRFFKSDY